MPTRTRGTRRSEAGALTTAMVVAIATAIPTPAADAQVVSLGAVLPLAASSQAISWQRMLNIALADVNASPAFGGARFNLSFLDSNGTASVSVHDGIVQALPAMGASQGVFGVIGEYSSGNTGPMMLALESFNVFTCTVSTSPFFSDKSQYPLSFRTVPSDMSQGYRLAELVRQNAWSRVGMVTVNSNYGLGLSQYFVQRAQSLNITILAQEAYNSVRSLQPGDFASQVDALTASDIRIVIFVGYVNDFVMFMRQARIAGIVGPNHVYIGPDAIYSVYESLYSAEGMSTYTNEDRENIEGLITTTPLENNTFALYANVTARYTAMYGSTPASFSYFYYDCLLSFAHGVKNLMNSGLSLATIVQNRAGAATLSQLTASSFIGASGNVTFDEEGDRLTGYLIANVVNGQQVEYMIADENGHFTTVQQLRFNGGSTTPPLDRVALTRDVIEATSVPGMLFFIINALGVLLCLACGAVLIVNKKTPPVKAMSLPFLLIALVGIAIEFVSVVSWVGRAEDSGVTCVSQQWFGWIGFSLVMQGVLPKCFRVYRIFENSKMLSATHLRDPALFLMSVPITLVNVALILSWQVLDPLRATYVADLSNSAYRYECKSTSQTLQRDLNASLTAYNGLLLLLTVLLAYATRGVALAYRETQFLMYAAQNMLVASCVVIALVYSSGSSYMATLYIRLALTWAAAMFVLIVNPGRVALASVWHRREKARGGEGLSGGSGREGVSAVSSEGTASSDRFVVGGDGVTEITLPVRDGGKAFAVWESRRVLFHPGTRMLTFLETKRVGSIGEAFVIDSSTTFNETRMKDVLEVRFLSKLKLLQFSSAHSLNKFVDMALSTRPATSQSQINNFLTSFVANDATGRPKNSAIPPGW